MPFKKHRLAALVEVDPKAAAKEILAAFLQGKGVQREAAKLLGAEHRTVGKWVRALGLVPAIQKLRERGRREGWYTSVKLSATQRAEIREALASGETQVSLARRFGVAQPTISAVLHGE